MFEWVYSNPYISTKYYPLYTANNQASIGHCSYEWMTPGGHIFVTWNCPSNSPIVGLNFRFGFALATTQVTPVSAIWVLVKLWRQTIYVYNQTYLDMLAFHQTNIYIYVYIHTGIILHSPSCSSVWYVYPLVSQRKGARTYWYSISIAMFWEALRWI